ncbi:MAG TPA: glutaredoxin family protein [Thermomicrobiales bacterium]|nr:glutaredoxin family protein [Thermomicrobiales bacterium]
MTNIPNEIVMYARERFCPDVTRTRLHLTDLGLTWTEFDVDADPEARGAAVKASGRSNVPTLIIGNQVLVEPSNAELDRALVAAGFDLSED